MSLFRRFLVTFFVLTIFALVETSYLLAQREDKRPKPGLSQPAEKKEPVRATPLPAPQKPIKKETFPLRSREIRGVDFIGTTQLESRQITGVDFIGVISQLQSRQITGVDFLGTPQLRSRQITGLDFIGTSQLRSREISGIDFLGTSHLRSRQISGVDFIGIPEIKKGEKTK